MKRVINFIAAASFIMTACRHNKETFDASGTFEAEEVIVSSEMPGKILRFDVEEGKSIVKGAVVAVVDAENIALQKEQVKADMESLKDKTTDVTPQVQLLKNQLAVQQSELATLLHEKARIERLLRQDAATGKQLDDIDAQIDVSRKNMDVTKQQIQVQQNNVATQNRSILSEGKPLSKRMAQLEDQLNRSNIVNPITGTVITTYAEEGEITSAGKALYKIADLSTVTLRAYITGTQLSQVRLGQVVKVLVDNGADSYKELPGTITWVSDKAEFTPKTIQTKEERANLVYAVKIRVKNDGYLKIGMYAEVKFM
jgi:HlyD family secretion protein